MVTVYRIVRWAVLYELSRHDVRHNGPLKFVKWWVHAAEQSPSLRAMIYQTRQGPTLGQAVGVTARDCFCLFGKLLEMAASEPRERRDGTIYARGLPAGVDQVARALWPLFDDSKQVQACLDVLCAPEVGWVEAFEVDLATWTPPATPIFAETAQTARRNGHETAHDLRRNDPKVRGADAGIDAKSALTITVTQPNRTGNYNENEETGTGTGASEARPDDRAGPASVREPGPQPGPGLLTGFAGGGDRRMPPGERHGALVSTLARLTGGPDVWTIKAAELMFAACSLDAAGRTAQAKPVTAVLKRISAYEHRDDLAATLIESAASKLRARVLRNPWGAWQKAADGELARRGLGPVRGERVEVPSR